MHTVKDNQFNAGIMNELDKLYSPSYWSKRSLAPDDLIKYHESFISKASARIRTQIPCQLNIPYGPMNREKFDIIGTDLDDDAAIFIFLHGGYWQMQSLGRESYEFIAGPLHKNNIKSIFIGYELCPDVTLSAIIQQVQTATNQCVEYARRKKSRGLYFAGHSAGGHLVSYLFGSNYFHSQNHQNVIKAVISVSGIFDLLPIQQTPYNLALKLDGKAAFELSPINQAVGSDLEVSKIDLYLVVGENESPEFLKQSQNYHDRLKEANVASISWTIENVDHFDIIELLSSEDFDFTKRIINLIKSKSHY